MGMTNEEFRKMMNERIERITSGDVSFGGITLGKMVFVDSDAEERSLTMDFTMDERDLNMQGMLHGGVTCLLMDIIMGVLVYAYVGGGPPTVDMNVSFFRPVKAGETLRLRSQINHLGRTYIHTEADIKVLASGKAAAKATGMYMAKNWDEIMSQPGWKV